MCALAHAYAYSSIYHIFINILCVYIHICIYIYIYAERKMLQYIFLKRQRSTEELRTPYCGVKGDTYKSGVWLGRCLS